MNLYLDPDDPLSRTLTITEAAGLVGKSPATLRSWIHRGHLTPLRIGRRTYVTERAALTAERATWRHTSNAA